MRYIRVKDKGTGHKFDVLLNQFDPEKHTEVKSGPYKGESDRPRRVQLNIKSKRRKPASKTSGEPSGDNQTESED